MKQETYKTIKVTPPNMNSPTKIYQDLKRYVQSQAPRYNLISISSNKKKMLSPLKTKTLQELKYVLPLFVMECQRAIKIHHQKEVVVRIVETVPTLRESTDLIEHIH